jgi:hypothetical protein
MGEEHEYELEDELEDEKMGKEETKEWEITIGTVFC